ncbi:ABC transporter permease [Paraburkholderia susongensis]|uniref:Putative spermidine/putrescine transport system permease protein n=1 Tax=Paraburkholderia susongensis TaxID=1515439 RepID=A0A1X7LHW9_9BURK|nr:ABC transporter permease [Paraburkholderia susongensis]SMG52789.1 putative spermidine/putrescine transport system permease protein [Paraburkholderia susongensis]
MTQVPIDRSSIVSSRAFSRSRPRLLPATWFVRAGVALIYLFMLSPLIFVIWLSFFKDAIITFPPSGYTLSWYVNAWHNDAFANGFVLSMKLAAGAALGGVVLGVAASLALARYRFAGRRLVGNVLLLPLVVPGIVAGIAAYLFYLRAENALDIDIVGTFGGLLLAHICLTIPWTIRLVTASLGQIDATVEEAARNLGAGPWRTLWRVTLPMLRPAIVASTLFGFIVSFENLEMTLPLVGPGKTTLPIAIMQYLEFNLDPTIAAVSAAQIVLLGIVMLITDRFVKLGKVI